MSDSARDDMRWARQYIDEYEKEPAYGYDHLNTALRYIQRARDKDPNVTLKAKSADKGFMDWTPDFMEAEVLTLQASSLIATHWNVERSNRDAAENAIPLLKRSIQLLPMQSSYKALATAYTTLHQRSQAGAIMNEAARRWPHDFSIRQTQDFYDLHPDIGVKPTNYKVPFIILTCFCLALALWGYKVSEIDPNGANGAANGIVMTLGLLARFGVILFGIIAIFAPSGKKWNSLPKLA